MFSGERDTIFASATGVGRAAIAILRVSGAGCASVLQALAPGKPIPERQAVVCALRDPATGDVLDRALILRFAAPRSFTGEDLVEIHITGGRAVMAALVAALRQIPGLRLAEAGEFSWRAFLNGKMDLAEVDGLADLVAAETEAQRRQAQRIAGGALSRECAAIRALLVEAMALIEAQIDFSDVEDADRLDLASVRERCAQAAARIDKALAGAEAAARLREGFLVVIAGPPNAGKSSLINTLSGREVAIASPFAGTTRDLIEVFLDLRGLPVILVDTAGLRESDNPIEQEGVARAKRRAAEADLALWLDETGAIEPPEALGAQEIWRVRSKSDLSPGQPAPAGQLAISVKTGDGMGQLLDAIADLAEERLSSREPAILTTERHRTAFVSARTALEAILAPAPILAPGLGGDAVDVELVAEDLRAAARALDSVVGRIDVEEVLGAIFSRLCVGK